MSASYSKEEAQQAPLGLGAKRKKDARRRGALKGRSLKGNEHAGLSPAYDGRSGPEWTFRRSALALSSFSRSSASRLRCASVCACSCAPTVCATDETTERCNRTPQSATRCRIHSVHGRGARRTLLRRRSSSASSALHLAASIACACARAVPRRRRTSAPGLSESRSLASMSAVRAQACLA